MPEDKITEDTHIQNALKIALEKEKKAYKFYQEGSKIVKDAGVRKLFKEMAVEEKNHVIRIKAEIDREIMREM